MAWPALSVCPPQRLLRPLHSPPRLLMGPGPSNCPPRVLRALGRQLLGHLHPETLQIMAEIKEGLKYVFQTNNRLTLAVSMTGHGGMEACMCNLIEAGDTVLIAENGIWGQRAADMAQRYGGLVRKLEKQAGLSFTINELEHALKNYKPVLFFITQGESSTGVLQNLEGFGTLCHRYSCLLVVDAVATLGGLPVLTDEWMIDAIYSGSQKVLGAPPGLAPISFSPKAEEKIWKRKTPVTVFSLDMTVLGDYWSCFGNPPVYHHTIPVSLLYSLREGLAIIVEEGLQNVWKRHKECAEQLHKGILLIGLRLFVEKESDRLPTVTTIKAPEDIDSKEISKYLMDKYFLEISGGLGPTVGKVLRIGLMGYNAMPHKVEYSLNSLQKALEQFHVHETKHLQSKL